MEPIGFAASVDYGVREREELRLTAKLLAFLEEGIFNWDERLQVEHVSGKSFRQVEFEMFMEISSMNLDLGKLSGLQV